MDDDTQKQMQALLEAEPPPALDRLREFLLHHVHDSDRNLLERQVRYMMSVNPNIPIDAVEAIEEILETPVSPGTLREIVMREGNHPLAERTDEAAGSWLRELAGDLRAWLGDYAPPPRGGLPGAR